MESNLTLEQAVQELEPVRRELREVKEQYAHATIENETENVVAEPPVVEANAGRLVEYPTEHPHIYTNPEMHGGEPTIRGSGIMVRTIVESTRVGYTVDELLEADPLTRAKIYDALSYYYDHMDEIGKFIQENEEALWRLTNRAST